MIYRHFKVLDSTLKCYHFVPNSSKTPFDFVFQYLTIIFVFKSNFEKNWKVLRELFPRPILDHVDRLGTPKSRQKEEGVCGAGAPHLLIKIKKTLERQSFER